MDESGLLKKIVNEKNENEPNKQKYRLHGMLLATLHATLLGNMLAGEGVT